jgi:hypothetical protein
MLWGADDEGDLRRRYFLAIDVAAPARRRGVIRALAVTGFFLVAGGMGLPSAAPAQTPTQGQAVGILLLLGAPRSGAQANAETRGQKPKASIAAFHEAEDRIADVKQKPHKVASPSDTLDGTVLRVTSDPKNARRLDQPVEFTDRTHVKRDWRIFSTRPR